MFPNAFSATLCPPLSAYHAILSAPHTPLAPANDDAKPFYLVFSLGTRGYDQLSRSTNSPSPDLTTGYPAFDLCALSLSAVGEEADAA